MLTINRFIWTAAALSCVRAAAVAAAATGASKPMASTFNTNSDMTMACAMLEQLPASYMTKEDLHKAGLSLFERHLARVAHANKQNGMMPIAQLLLEIKYALEECAHWNEAATGVAALLPAPTIMLASASKRDLMEDFLRFPSRESIVKLTSNLFDLVTSKCDESTLRVREQLERDLRGRKSAHPTLISIFDTYDVDCNL